MVRFSTIEAQMALMVPFLFFRCEPLTSQISLYRFDGKYRSSGCNKEREPGELGMLQDLRPESEAVNQSQATY